MPRRKSFRKELKDQVRDEMIQEEENYVKQLDDLKRVVTTEMLESVRNNIGKHLDFCILVFDISLLKFRNRKASCPTECS